MEKKKINAKLFLIQKMLLKFEKNADNPFFKSRYTDLPNLLSVLLPVLNKLNVLLYHIADNGKLTTIFWDIDSGEWMGSSLAIPEGLDAQKVGSAITYFKRYNIGMMLNITTDVDDDGNSASGKVKKEKKGVINQDKPPFGPGSDDED
jgi:hypothetical protein